MPTGKILRFRSGPSWKSWSAQLAEMPDPEGYAVEHVVVTFFQAPRSYTAEDVSRSAATARPSCCAIA